MAADAVKAFFNQGAVFTRQRRHVSHGADCHQVQPRFRVHFRLGVGGQVRLGQLISQPHAGQILLRVGVSRLAGVDQRSRRGQHFTGSVMIGDDQIHSQ